MSKINHPPKLAAWLLQKVLPANVCDDISGDLHEEYSQKLTKQDQLIACQQWFWWQTLLACGRHAFTMPRAIFAGLMSAFVSVFLLLFVSVIFLSCADHTHLVDQLFARPYWLNGAIHQMFFDPLYWQALYSVRSEMIFELGMLFSNLPSAIWALCWMTIIYFVDKRYQLNAIQFAGLSLVAICGLYLWGAFSIALDTSVQLRTVGPTIAYMWLSVMYLILPLGLMLSKKVKASLV